MVVSYLQGLVIFAVVVGSVTDIIDDLNMKRSLFQKKVDAVKSYMSSRKVNRDIQERVLKWFDHSWLTSEGLDERLIFQVGLLTLEFAYIKVKPGAGVDQFGNFWTYTLKVWWSFLPKKKNAYVYKEFETQTIYHQTVWKPKYLLPNSLVLNSLIISCLLPNSMETSLESKLFITKQYGN